MGKNGMQILIQSLEKKIQILDELIKQNGVQEHILKQDSFDMDAFDATIDAQAGLVEKLEKLDSGFETLYERLREEVLKHKEQYRHEIAKLQSMIQQITDKVVVVNTGNMRNKMLAENQFKKEKQSIQQSVSKSKVARNYYNSMNNLNCVAPQFYDNKK
ncbi:MAG: flagellar protein FliT [Lachnospiraceae bacterium]|nr:flagellar protein FliT [Lachnospiraceae bacterium]